VDSQPLPVCTFKRATRCKFKGARYGFSTAGPVFGFKLHAWTGLNGRISRYEIIAANEHDFSVLCEMNRQWPVYNAPKQIGDKGYQSGTCLTPPKSNARRPVPRWKVEFGSARKIHRLFFFCVGGCTVALGAGQVHGKSTLEGCSQCPCS